MKALRFEEFGSPSVLSQQDVPMPSAGPDEVLVQVRAAGINPSDLANLRGRFHATLPRTLGEHEEEMRSFPVR